MLPRPRPSTSDWTNVVTRLDVHADVRAEEVLVGGELGAGALDGDLPGAQHVAAVGDLERPQGVLLDDEDRAAPLAELDEQVEDGVDQHRREAERRLVEQHEARLAHQRPGDGELLGLAAGQVAGGGVPPAGEHVEAGAGLVEPAAAFAPARTVTPASWRFSPTVRSRKIRRCSGTRASPAPHERRRLGAGDVRRRRA